MKTPKSLRWKKQKMEIFSIDNFRRRNALLQVWVWVWVSVCWESIYYVEEKEKEKEDLTFLPTILHIIPKHLEFIFIINRKIGNLNVIISARMERFSQRKFKWEIFTILFTFSLCFSLSLTLSVYSLHSKQLKRNFYTHKSIDSIEDLFLLPLLLALLSSLL